MAFLRSAARLLFGRARMEREMEDELRSHIRSRADDLVYSGLTRPEAERRARIEFGGVERYKEECRESRSAHFLETLTQDIGYAGRLLRKSPGFAAVTILTLALGIGANTAIFSLIYSVLLRSLPYPHPEQLVLVLENNQKRGVKFSGCSVQDLTELRNSGIFVEAGGVARHDLTLTGSGDPAPVSTMVATPEIFSVVQVQPLAGRYLLADDEIKGAAPVVVLSEGLWRSRFGSNPGLIGTAITLDQRPFTVVGIMPAAFQVPVFGKIQEIWIPAIQDPLYGPWVPKRDLHWMATIARLNPSISLPRAQSEADAVLARLGKEFPIENGGWGVHVSPLHSAVVEDARTPLLVLMGAVGLVLLLACVNIANLLLARATARTRELAVRQALGAGRGRIIRQLLTESATLGGLGAIVGLGMAFASARTLTLFLPSQLIGMGPVKIDGWTLAFALLLSMCATVAFGLAPAVLMTASSLQQDLKDSAARAGSGGGKLRVRRFLAAGEIGLAIVLVVGAGLLVRSLIRMTSVNPGFNVTHILKAEIQLPQYRYSTPHQWVAFHNEFLDRIRAQHGFEDSASAVPVPLANNSVTVRFEIADHAAPAPGSPSNADWVSVSPGFFHLMGIPLLRGRLFQTEDSEMSPPVTLISESFARIYFPGEDPVGKRLKFGFHGTTPQIREIVGVVGNIRNAALTKEAGPIMYVPFAQAPLWGVELLVKSDAPTANLVATIRDVTRGMDKDLPVFDVAEMSDVIDSSVAQPRFRTWLLSAFGAVALLLAAVGVFGVVSYSVASRTREFGVRSALGASPGSIQRMILKEGLGLGVGGLITGLAVAAGLARFLKGELYGIATYDPATFSISAAVLLAVAIVACYLPARRAMRVDPVVALRCE